MKFIKFLLLFNFALTYNFEFSLSNKFQNIEFNRNNVYSDLYSNAIYEITNDNFESQDTIWLRTGAGLSFITFSNSNSPLFNSILNENLPEGGTPAYIIKNNLIALSGAKSIYQNNRYRPMGTGISWSHDNGSTWNYINQPLDNSESSYTWISWGDQDSIKFKSINTQIYNVSYDIEEFNGYIYATSFAGGLRRFNYNNSNPEWELIPLPLDNQTSLFCNNIDTENYQYNPVDPPDGNDNHKAFSVFIDENIIWVGTGDGINKGIINEENDCIDWVHYNESDGMGDRWIIGIRNQTLEDEINRLWAVSWDPSLNKAIPHKLTFTEDNGLTWDYTSFFEGIGAIVYDLNFDGDTIFASTDKGLYKNDGINFELWIPYQIQDQSQSILTDIIYSSNVNEINDDKFLWAGSPDGLFYSNDDGYNWTMYRTWNKTSSELNFSAYPNPFYINEGFNFVRIVYDNNTGLNPELDIYDFSMQHIINIDNVEIVGDSRQFIWDGRNKVNNQVSNGVYFCRLNLNGTYHWTKLMVIK